MVNLKHTLNNDRESRDVFYSLLEYRVLYFVDIPLDYLNKFYNADRVWEYEARRHGFGLRHCGKTVKDRRNVISDYDRHSVDITYCNVSL